MKLPLREDLVGLEPYGAPQLDVPVRLNVNENPFPPPAQVVDDIADAVRQAAQTCNRYPDRDFIQLRERLAQYLGHESAAPFLRSEHLWAANGSNEVMLQLFQAFGGPGRTALSFAPSYSMYPEYARDTCTRWVTEQRTADYGIDPSAAAAAVGHHHPVLVVVANPNNPTGTTVGPEVIEALCDATWNGGEPTAVVVVDEAYAEFRRLGVGSAVELLPRYPHLAVSRTMSKAFAFAGVRVGYLAADPSIIDALRIVRLPYHLSAVTQATALAALRHTDVLLEHVELLRKERDSLVTWLRQQRLGASGLDVADSDANFVLFGRFPDRDAVWEGLLARGVLIRQTGPQGYLRVSVGTPAENEQFRQALVEVIG